MLGIVIIDTIEMLAALERSGVRTARTAYVDSPESAVAFAERRDAKDPRFMPIRLRGDDEIRFGNPLESEVAVRDEYARLERAGNGRMVAQVALQPGEELSLIAETGPTLEKTLRCRPSEQAPPSPRYG